MKLFVTTLALSGGLVGSGPAQGALFTGNWDPAFGAAFPDLGWRGDGTFFVPDACLALNGWVLNSDPCSMSEMKLLDAEVGFYKLSDSTNPAFQETLTFGTPSSQVLSMRIDDGMLAGLYGTFDYSVGSTLPLAGGPFSNFVLFFGGDIARMAFHYDPPGELKRDGVSDEQAPDGSRPFITFRAVPEPGSVGLMLTALALLSAVRRRKTANA